MFAAALDTDEYHDPAPLTCIRICARPCADSTNGASCVGKSVASVTVRAVTIVMNCVGTPSALEMQEAAWQMQADSSSDASASNTCAQHESSMACVGVGGGDEVCCERARVREQVYLRTFSLLNARLGAEFGKESFSISFRNQAAWRVQCSCQRAHQSNAVFAA